MNRSVTRQSWRSAQAALAAFSIAATLAGCGGSSEDQRAVGAFYGVEGLTYESAGSSGVTGAEGALRFDPAASVKFSVGTLALGVANGGERLTVADLVPEAAGDIRLINLPKVTNRARFLQSLDDDANVENGIRISSAVATTVSAYAGKISFDQSEDAFTADPNVGALFAQLGRSLVNGAQARNPLRRTLQGIRKLTDVDVPMRDGTKLKANVWRPIAEGKYPVLVNVGAYGKDWSGFENDGCICNGADLLKKAQQEDEYFQGIPSAGTPPGYVSNHEHHETINTVDWVPKGYVKVLVDDRGRCNSPGKYEQFSLQESKDFYDAVEWAAVLPYSNGNTGVWGISYWAMVTLPMAAQQPPSLKAIMPLFTDADAMRTVMFNGGLWNNFNFIAGRSCRADTQQVDWITAAKASPFYSDAQYGPSGSLTVAADLSKINIPMYTAMPLEHPGIHTKGSSETFIGVASKNKKFAIVEGDLFGWTYAQDTVAEHIAFMDYWLKGKTDNGAMNGAPVKMKIRTGDGKFVWQEENEWPVARTEYRRLYLNAAASSYTGNGQRSVFQQLSLSAPTAPSAVSWDASIPSGATECWKPGVSFVTEPLTEDITVAGYMKLVGAVSSTSTDMDIVTSVRVIDPSNKDITLAFPNFFYNPQYPLGIGWLQVSKRKLDPFKSTLYRPVYSMTLADYAPLIPGVATPLEVEIWPTTGKILKGSRLRLDVTPTDGCGAPATALTPPTVPGHLFNPAYKNGHTNTLHTGPSVTSYLQIPVIPQK